jgi:uncharacterized ferritin-like protein (DUF455 family)
MAAPAQSLTGAAVAVLSTADASEKAAASRTAAAAWRDGAIEAVGASLPPNRPDRPARPELRRPADMPKRGAGQSAAGRIALLHAIAHIELNAIDLAWDIVARFADAGLPQAFFDDWVRVADEEAKHFTLLSERLAALGAAYGDLPAHDGLWEAAEATAHDLLARLAVVPLVLEARGLDVTPTMIARMTRFGDDETAAVLTTIYEDEIGHVATGMRWFAHECERRGTAPESTWRALVAAHFKGAIKPPFNDDARAQAGMTQSFYAALSS